MTGGLLMAAFAGRQPTPALLRRLVDSAPAGLTLFRQHNVGSPAELRALTDALQAAVPPDQRPLLVAADQEGGQLIGLGAETTAFAGAMALGAAGDEDLAERVARATAREMLALGVNVNYAPVCDLATNPDNPGLGIRSFGDDPAAVARLVAATVRGLQAEGVAATAKHFPGKGDSGVDTHHRLAVVDRSPQQMHDRELVPFRAAFEAGAQLVMAGHFALPQLTDDETLPASLAHAVLTDLLRDELGYDGLCITDALDMRALAQGAAQAVDVIAAVRAGADLLLGTADDEALERIGTAVEQACRRQLIEPRTVSESARRVESLRAWLRGFEQPALEVVGSGDHAALAQDLAERSVTLVRDDAGLLPLRLPAGARVLVVMPQPADLTPADTSSYVVPALAAEVRRRRPSTDEVVTALDPADDEIAALRSRATDYDLIVLGTLSASLQPAQAAMARALIESGRPLVSVALRTPWDLAAYPQATTHALSYGIQPASIAALVAALFGEIPFRGRLPVELAGLYPRGHGG